ncbi:hypothetical protein GWK47_044287 [Chionoecetes opilio]|uniref:Uncharacterized protein n=1 Tax=Chionoecetes opilio TaxID=41210 RepID=A0A8J4Y8H9_CHIOP|nr:hypothetical protein GWK47_044287 [Chionoecetes opilio]
MVCGGGSVVAAAPVVASLVAVCAVAVYVCVYVARRRRRRAWAEARCVVVHCPSPGSLTPSISPFVMKLLTFLRLARIPYQHPQHHVSRGVADHEGGPAFTPTQHPPPAGWAAGAGPGLRGAVAGQDRR